MKGESQWVFDRERERGGKRGKREEGRGKRERGRKK